jgi:hypothetical protein
MRTIGLQDAIARARAQSGVDTSVQARAWFVRRLDRHGEAYYLVEFGEDCSVLAVAAVGAVQGEILTWARLPGNEPHLLSEEHAVKRVDVEGGAQAELVWQPCRATCSLLYPLWEVQLPAKTVYVDQQGVVWTSLTPAGPGG